MKKPLKSNAIAPSAISESAANNLFMQAPVAIVILRGNNYIVELANDTYLQMVGKDETFIGKPLLALLPELNTQGIKEILDGVMQTGLTYQGHQVEITLQHHHPQQKGFYDFVYQPIQEKDAKVTGIMVIVTDVSKQVMSVKKMQDQTAWLQELLMKAPGFVCTLVGPTHIYDLVNAQYQSMFGARKLQGKPLLVALPELVGQGLDTLLDTVYTTGKTFVGVDIPITMARDEGLQPELRYFNFSYQPIYDDSKKINAILVFGYEVTDQVIAKNKNLESEQLRASQLEESVRQRTEELSNTNALLALKNEELQITKEQLLSEYSRNLIEATLDPLITIDIRGNITDVNEAMIKATDKRRGALIGSSFINYFIQRDEAKQVFETVFSEGHVMNYPLTIVDGVMTDVLINASTFKDGKGHVQGAVIVARDITAIKKIQKDLNEAIVFAETATGIAEIAKVKADTARNVAEEAVKSKQQFLSNMSHEIRTPMNAIIGFTKVLLKTELSAKQKEYLMAIKLSGDSLIVLINDILDLAKVDAGKMEFEQIPFKMDLSISAMLHLFETRINEKNLELVKHYDPRIPKVVVGDPVRLHQIILNLLSNAVKFTSRGKITVSLHLINEDDKKVTIEFMVADTGIGIHESKTEKIFENFQQATTGTSRLYGGTGLGLAIVKQLVESQGGKIQVISRPDEGAAFSFTLDFMKTTESAELNSLALLQLDSEMKDIKVLVVEDMPLNQLLMKTLLDDFGFEREIAGNGRIAIEKLEAKSYDIILMDLQMPEMNGFEATEYIRNVMHSNIPIIALTADVTTVDLAKCKAVGMNDYIAKPVDERVLYSKIVGLVKKPESIAIEEATAQDELQFINLAYLRQLTKANTELMLQMISAYLAQTPPLISAMKQSFSEKNWKQLSSAIHKMIPSFSIMGIHAEYEKMARKVQEYATLEKEEEMMEELVLKLEAMGAQVCKELEIELIALKSKQHGK